MTFYGTFFTLKKIYLTRINLLCKQPLNFFSLKKKKPKKH